MKQCYTCKQSLKEEEFPFRNKLKNIRHTKCRECQKIYSRDHYKKNKKEHNKRRYKNKKLKIDKLKEKRDEYLLCNSCVDCGEKDIIVLDFDHVKGEKFSEISTLIRKGYSWEVIFAEIKKCEIRCSNCHRKKHYYERHGARA